MEIPHGNIFRFVAGVFFSVVPLVAADPILGTWKLNLVKSRFLPGPPSRTEIRTYEQQSDGVKVAIRTVDSKGKPATSVYLTTPDGQQLFERLD